MLFVPKFLFSFNTLEWVNKKKWNHFLSLNFRTGKKNSSERGKYFSFCYTHAKNNTKEKIPAHIY